ncbi:MAG: hypothetical protein IPM92_17180 [Saprospiraceae bacterium]|nr:hypothetical protein [Saprospiraceae bacterium]
MKASSIKVLVLISIIIFTFLIFNSCKKIIQVKNTWSQTFDNSLMTQATFLGQVFQEDGNPWLMLQFQRVGIVSQTDVMDSSLLPLLLHQKCDTYQG